MNTNRPDPTPAEAGRTLPRPVPFDPARADAAATEWLLTNGIGGFAMGTVLGAPTRRYHALLVAAMKPPVERIAALHAIDERLTIDRGSASERSLNLTRFHFDASPDRPRSHAALVRFERGPFCLWRYQADGVDIEKRLHVFHGRNAVEVRYTLRAPGRRVRLQLRPLVALRDFHTLRRKPAGASIDDVFQCRGIGMGVVVVADHLGVVITSDAPRFRPDPAWWTGLHYEREHDRGQDHIEDLYTPGEFILDSPGLDHAVSATVYATADARPTCSVEQDVAQRSARIAAMADAAVRSAASPPDAPTRDAVERLCAAGDEFVVPRGGSATDPYGKPGLTVLAGYPWFADWGRDTMIALPGLLIATGRHDDASGVLATFAAHRRGGVIPNRFDDRGGPPHFNTADASLWFIHAVHELWLASGAVEPHLLEACLDIIHAYRDGTHAGDPARPEGAASGDLADAPGGPIRMDPDDGLIAAGDEQTQLTWMDARRDGISFTPRAGKAVEINALWHHALRSVAAMVRRTDEAAASDLELLAARVAGSFQDKFWNPNLGCLLDLVPDPDAPLAGQPAAQVRPNQVFAAAVEHTPLTPAQRGGVIRIVRERLLTPVGLRTLDPADPHFRPRYAGPLRRRDEAYHNGTVWPWLLGPLAEATLRAGGFSRESRAAARAMLDPLMAEMNHHCPGQLAEVYDGDTPTRPGARHPRPDGCPAQAWSVAMTLRALVLTLGRAPA